MIGHNEKIISTLATAGVLMTFAADVLSDFERETLATVCERFIACGPETQITRAEWDVVHQATCAMVEHVQPGWIVSYRAGADGKPVPDIAPAKVQ